MGTRAARVATSGILPGDLPRFLRQICGKFLAFFTSCRRQCATDIDWPNSAMNKSNFDTPTRKRTLPWMTLTLLALAAFIALGRWRSDALQACLGW